MNPINPEEFRYIKLGRGGSWAQPAFERGELHFGYRTVSHDLCLRGVQGDWEAVTRFLTEAGRSLGKARDGVREIRDFYTLGSDCLWITFAEGHLWWAFAEPEVTWLGMAEDGQGSSGKVGYLAFRWCMSYTFRSGFGCHIGEMKVF